MESFNILSFIEFWCCTLWSSNAPLGILQNRRVGEISLKRRYNIAVFGDIAEYNNIAIFNNRTRLCYKRQGDFRKYLQVLNIDFVI